MSSMPAPTMMQSKSDAECQRWMQRVHDAQSRRSPEACAAALQRAEQARCSEVSRRKCKAVKGHVVRSRALAATCLGQMASSSPHEHLGLQERWRSAQEASRSRQVQALSRADRASAPRFGAAAAAAPADLLEDSDEEEEEAMREAAVLVGAADARSMAALGSEGLASAAPAAVGQPAAAHVPGGGGSVEALLSQLRTEPRDESECAAKFMLYEGYASEVEQMRGSLMKFHGESWATVPESVAGYMDRQVAGIDSQQAMGVPDDAREWLVFHMMRKAERNNLRMAAILEDFEKRLEFLAANDQSECPVCLEPFVADGGDRSPETLGCCHKVCRDCWQHWSAVTHGQPFCPLCRHNEFLGAVASHVSAGR